MANPGYGKRSAPLQLPRTGHDFAHLPPREASLAALIDRLPEGAAVDGKSLAAVHPLYGQAACLTALRRLSEAGHLRRFREHLVHPDGSRWVTRTYFTRTPRDDAWWADFQAGRLPEEPPVAEPAPRPAEAGRTTDPEDASPEPSVPPPRGVRAPSPAYRALASLSRADPRLTLSAADCTALEPLAAVWLGRDPSPERFVQALTAGLPVPVHSPRGLLRSRLRAKLPPEPVTPPAVPARTPLRLVECAVCRAPGRAGALPGGVCAACRGRPGPGRQPKTATGVPERVARLRALVRAGGRPQPVETARRRDQAAP
ncbi:hypothetical protein HOY81_14440 [Streptomyces sp. JJ36]|nr:hypothetical protein [Streptomyces sp. JJ36]